VNGVQVDSPTALGRLRRLELSPARFLQMAAVSLGSLWLIVLTGAAVRLTDSGLGCRHWPGCEKGNALPAKDYHAFIEFGNRALGGVVISLVLLTTVAAYLTPRLTRQARRLALAIFVGTLAQAPLGYLAVNTDLQWPVVAAHLLLSMALLAGAVMLVLEAVALSTGRAEPVVPMEVRRLGLALVTAAAALVVTGSLATAGGPHSGGGAERVDRLWRLQPLVFVHAAAVAAFGIGLVFLLGYLAAQRSRWPRLFALALSLFALLLVQVGLGELQYRTQLPWPLVLVHVGIAAAVWALLVAFVTVLWRPPAVLVQPRA
jgi:heme a synthase